MFNIVQLRKWFFVFSGILIVIGVLAMALSVATYPEHSPVRLSIDFLGGTLMDFEFVPKADATPGNTPITEGDLSGVFAQYGLTDVRLQRLSQIGATDSNRWEVRTGFIDNENTEKLKNSLDELAQTRGLQLDRNTLHSNQVSPTVGKEVTQAAFFAVVVASLAVLLWIFWAFRSVQDSARYGVCAVIAMIHDIVIMIGAMSVMGLIFKWEADALFLTGLLTVVGYSVQDTIVVFDRIRENAQRHRGEPYDMIVNRSILETLGRSISMQLVVAFVLLSLFLMGGASIHQFVGVLLIGLLSGTYSSTFVAMPLLVAWEHGQLPLLNRIGAAKVKRST
jgi:preprotein translocase SecF subunit